MGCFFIFLLLIFKDPFSQRTLIPNFEPHPDTFYYINPALNLIKGQGFNINREGRVYKANVPPLYSFSLLPSFIFKADPRMAYYSNLILAYISLLFFWLILKRIFASKLIIYPLLILYITNYFIYWVPSIIMAENLTLTLYLAAVFFLLSKATTTNLIILSIMAVATYGTKYANIPVTLSVIALTLRKVFFDQKSFGGKISQMLFFLIFIVSSFLMLGIFESLIKGNNIFSQIFGYLLRIYNSIVQNYVSNSAVDRTGAVYTSSWFGIEYVGRNVPLYLKSLIGSPNPFLWDNTPLVPKLISIFGIIGIFISFLNKSLRFISVALMLFMSSLIIFMSTFYAFDARYIYVAVPTLLIGFGLFFKNLEDKIRDNKKIIFNALIVIFIITYLITNLGRIKSQISLNLRYAETPWYYIAVLKMNEYFTKDKIADSKKPILISALPPFLIDYYSNGNYILLPLSYEQEFRGQEVREIVWGPNDYSDLSKLYRKYLNEGYEVYVSRAGLGNEGYTNRDFNTIVREFDTKLVLFGCYDQCNIYRVRLKNDEL